MATNTHLRAAGSALLVAALLGSSAAAKNREPAGAIHQTHVTSTDDPDLDGRDTREAPTNRPTVEAAFSNESYSPGSTARLSIWTGGTDVRIRLYRAGTETTGIVARDIMLGSPVTAARLLGDIGKGDVFRIRVGNWPSGLYFAKLTGSEGKIGYAPFVLRPHRLGEHGVAVVFSTMTWQAYNFHDDNGDGVPDTWYQNQNDHSLTARLGRPYENRGVIPHYKFYEQPFVRWLVATHRDVDYLADADLDLRTTTGRKLAAAYSLIVFPGHHEYVTTHEYDAVLAYRNRGGNLMFLSANNFFWRTVKEGNVMRRTAHWRDLGRPEAALLGTQYFANDAGEHRGSWIVRRTPAESWIFARTKLRPGSSFANGGIEADEVAPSSPPGTQVIAAIPRLFDTPHNADMTYYELPNGAKVFAAGAFTLAGAVWWENVHQVIENLFARLTDDGNRTRVR
ncbi:MAG: N,N-dimethylformamidase beta subunit family domain-containing protein [Gaiellaceae bacterium]